MWSIRQLIMIDTRQQVKSALRVVQNPWQRCLILSSMKAGTLQLSCLTHQLKMQLEAAIKVLSNQDYEALVQQLSPVPGSSAKGFLLGLPCVTSLVFEQGNKLVDILSGKMEDVDQCLTQLNVKHLVQSELKNNKYRGKNIRIKGLLKLINREATQAKIQSHQQSDNYIKIQSQIQEGKAFIVSQLRTNFTQSLKKGLNSLMKDTDSLSFEFLLLECEKLEPALRKLVDMIQKVDNQKTSNESILRQCLYQANNLNLDIKGGNTIKMIARAKEAYKTLQGKTLVLLFGKTGSGKSTTANYLIGNKLMYFHSSIGEKLVRTAVRSSQQATIGHSISSSQTIYSQGYELASQCKSYLGDDLSFDLTICDNPGFSDSRSRQFTLMTYLSMDQAIDRCTQIKAVCLVIAKGSFQLERSSHFVELMSQMEDKFKQLLIFDKETFKSFAIFITKSNKAFAESFIVRVQQMIQQENQIINTLTAADILARQNSQKRLRYFKACVNLLLQQRLWFIDIQDQFEQLSIVQEIATCPGITKSNYNHYMSVQSTKQQFVQLVAAACSTWVSLLNQFFETNPDKIKSIRELYQVQKHKRVQNEKYKNKSQIRIDKLLDNSKVKIKRINNCANQHVKKEFIKHFCKLVDYQIELERESIGFFEDKIAKCLSSMETAAVQLAQISWHNKCLGLFMRRQLQNYSLEAIDYYIKAFCMQGKQIEEFLNKVGQYELQLRQAITAELGNIYVPPS